MAEQEQEAKRRRVEGDEEKTTAEEKPAELEKDATGKLETFKEHIGFQLSDCTLNVVPAMGGRVLTPLTDGGLQYFMAAARANIGVKGGRYFFEAKIVEMMVSTESAAGAPRAAPIPRQVLRVGVATQGQSLFLGETEDSVCFDSEGFTTCDKKREYNGKRFLRGQTVGILVNLDPTSTNKHTVSLFLDGQRATQPTPLPESMHGKALFPVVNFRNVTVHMNFGVSALKPLPFACRTFQQVDSKDAVKATSGGPGKDGKYEVLFPVAVPDEATFDWLDEFLAKNPQFCEVSERAMIKWAESSGMSRAGGGSSWKSSNDKPDVHFAIPMMDDASARRVLNSVMATQPRNYVIMEVKGNLLPEERAATLQRFALPQYKKVAQVTMGPPPAEFTKAVHEELLKQKQESEELAWKARKAERERKKAMEAQQKRIEEAMELNRRKEEALKAADDATKDEEGAKPEDVKTEEEIKAEVKDEELQAVKEEPKEDDDEPMPAAHLTEEERKQHFRKKAVPDLTAWNVGSGLAKFKLPEKDEGFDDIRFAWASDAEARAYFKAWLVKEKLMCRLDELAPGDWFKNRWTEWQQLLAEWQNKNHEYNNPHQQALRRAQADEAARLKADAEARAKADAETKAQAEAYAKAQEEAEAKALAEAQTKGEGDQKPEGAVEGEPKADGEQPKVDGEKPQQPKESAEPKVEGEKKVGLQPKEPKEVPPQAAEKPVESADAPKPEPEKEVDVFSVENVMDIGDGAPLFAHFTWQDWALLSLRLELTLLVHAFKKDSNDPERLEIHESHLGFYYHKYFSKAFTTRYYGADTNADVVRLVKDAIEIKENGALATSVPEEFAFDVMVRRTEEDRRTRQHRLNAGDESARLNFNRPPEAPRGGARVGGYAPVIGSALPPPPAPGAPPAYGGGKGRDGPYSDSKGGGKSQSFGKGGVCRSFQMHGNCSFGARCRFGHAS